MLVFGEVLPIMDYAMSNTTMTTAQKIINLHRKADKSSEDKGILFDLLAKYRKELGWHTKPCSLVEFVWDTIYAAEKEVEG